MEAASKIIQSQVDAGTLESAVLLVRRGGRTFSHAFGKAASADALFLLGSITKTMTAAGAMVLADRGELRHASMAAEQATGLYRGPLFQDDAAADWFAPERRWLHEQHVELLEVSALWLLELDDVAGARMAASHVLRDEPCRESGHRLLMRCYARQHQRDLVARQYRLCVAELDKQLGVGPTLETVRLYEQLARPA